MAKAAGTPKDVDVFEEAKQRLADEYRQSTFRESLLEHAFISEVLQEAWFGRSLIIEVLRSEVDAFGYDLVVQLGGVVRHVQLKASRVDAATKKQTVNLKLAEKPRPCVVWILYQESNRRVMLSYRFFEVLDPDGHSRLGDKPATNPATGKPRKNSRDIPKGAFESVATTADLLDRLFDQI